MHLNRVIIVKYFKWNQKKVQPLQLINLHSLNSYH